MNKLKKLLLSSFLLISLFFNSWSENFTHYVGGDISLLSVYEDAGAKYRDENGEPISDLLQYLYDAGMNSMRVRLFVNPDDFEGHDPNACQSLPFILPLCKRIVDDGFDLMLDFHYSDTWADPGAQWIPKQWEGLNDDELVETIYEYTKETLLTLKENGIIPKFIQPGNEISYGMLWSPYGAPESEQKKTFINNPANWERLGRLLRSAISACREVCPDASIVIHTERVADVEVQNNFYNKMKELDVDYEIIGLSYYPYWHGNIDTLKKSLSSLEEKFPEKQIMIVETGYSYKWAIGDNNVDYPLTEEGQNEFAQTLVETLLNYQNVTGLYWWWLEYNAYGTQLENWYNAPLFNSLTGKATPALKTICKFRNESGLEKFLCQQDYDDLWYRIDGSLSRNYPGRGLFIHKGKVILK